jgi:hypothetical protein
MFNSKIKEFKLAIVIEDLKPDLQYDMDDSPEKTGKSNIALMRRDSHSLDQYLEVFTDPKYDTNKKDDSRTGDESPFIDAW